MDTQRSGAPTLLDWGARACPCCWAFTELAAVVPDRPQVRRSVRAGTSTGTDAGAAVLLPPARSRNQMRELLLPLCWPSGLTSPSLGRISLEASWKGGLGSVAQQWPRPLIMHSRAGRKGIKFKSKQADDWCFPTLGNPASPLLLSMFNFLTTLATTICFHFS